ncbi:MAG: hypothetical protein OEW30_21990 [Acidimicrobiia bacterium]|nr:hypothetical protein [Acidimicrobiia bacterium]MDH5292400.1 hypothetical protein [Acidimicrobiia bacterium]
MAWYWTDDLARLLRAAGDPGAFPDWTQRPVAFAAPDDVDPLDFARTLLGRMEGAA